MYLEGDKMNFYYIADCHFGHENIIKLCNRPFNSVEEMDETMITNWNRKVTNNDLVLIVGDMFYKHPDPESVLKRLKGRKWLICGNHDGNWIANGGKRIVTDYLEEVLTNNTFNDSTPGGGFVHLCHYPYLMWDHMEKHYMIHGHMHNRKEEPFWSFIKGTPTLLNAGVDINNFEPVTLAELKENNRIYKG